MQSLLKAIELAGTQSALAKGITDNMPDADDMVTPQQIWNWVNRDKVVPAQYCPAVEKFLNGAVKCEELNNKVDWPYLRKSKK